MLTIYRLQDVFRRVSRIQPMSNTCAKLGDDRKSAQARDLFRRTIINLSYPAGLIPLLPVKKDNVGVPQGMPYSFAIHGGGPRG